MLFDFNEAWPRVTQVRYDVCIAGTGPAGITVARKLAAYGKKVILLEAGGFSYSDELQDHYRGKNVGRTYWLETSRLRYLGGSSNHWGGVCVLQEPITFQTNNDGLPGWPISYEQVVSNLPEAKEILDIAGKNLFRSKRPDFMSSLFDCAGIALSPPTRFFEKYGAELKQSELIDVFYNANLVDLTLNENLGRVKSIRVQNYKNKVSEVFATQYVLALGGIDNVRILLNANRQVTVGIGNHSGMVGRCFMEGLNVPIGRFLVTDPKFWEAGSPPLCPTETLMRQKDIGNGIISFDPHISAPAALNEGGRLRVLKEFIHETGCLWPTVTALARQIKDFNCPGDGVISSTIEQSPNPSSRVTLTGDVDFLGLRRVQMDWQFADHDLRTIRVLSIELAKEMARLNRARVQLAPFILDSDLEIPATGFGHHMEQLGCRPTLVMALSTRTANYTESKTCF